MIELTVFDVEDVITVRADDSLTENVETIDALETEVLNNSNKVYNCILRRFIY